MCERDSCSSERQQKNAVEQRRKSSGSIAKNNNNSSARRNSCNYKLTTTTPAAATKRAQTSSSSSNKNNKKLKAATDNMEVSQLPVGCSSLNNNNLLTSTTPPAAPSTSSPASSNSSPASTIPTSSASCSPAPQSSASIGVNLRVTGQCSQGGRKYMEDYFSVAYQPSENAKDLEYAFIGIYDGHGGAEAATFAKQHLMMEIINQKLFWSDNDQDVLRAIREGYIATHYAMWRDQEKWPKTATGLPSTAGTTATVAFIRREKIYIGHVGDSGIVLGYQNENEKGWLAKPLTTDHKPESVEERTRIMRSGGKVVSKSGVPRVVWNRPRMAGHQGPVRRNTPVDEIPFLAVARSLGDLWSYNAQYNEFVVSPDPDVKVIKINPKTFRCLIFGTDGLWNVVSAQEAVDAVRQKELINECLQAQRGASPAEGSHGQWTNPSKALVERALKTWGAKKMRADNTSVVTVILYPPGSSVKDNAPSCQTHSYGVEYMQVNAEIPTLDVNDEDNDASGIKSTTYAELANKYLPPVPYQNFKYDEDEDAVDDVYAATMHYSGNAYAPRTTGGSCAYPLYQNAFNNINEHNYYETSHNIAVPVVNGITELADVAEEDEEDGDEDDDNDAEEDLYEDAIGIVDGAAIAGEVNCATTNVAVGTDVAAHAEVASYASTDASGANDALDYMHSFADTYTGILSANSCSNSSDSTDTNNSNNSNNSSGSGSNSYHSYQSNSYQSNSYQSNSYESNSYYAQQQQHEILREQQQYQQLCMSQEEGYSLTKLETRGEQQMRQGSVVQATKQVAAFKIFQQPQQQEEQPPQQLPNVVYEPLEAAAETKQSIAAPMDLEETLCEEEYLEEEVEQQHILKTTSSFETLTTCVVDKLIQIHEITSSIASPVAAAAEAAAELMEIDAVYDEEEEFHELTATVQTVPVTAEQKTDISENIELLEKVEILCAEATTTATELLAATATESSTHLALVKEGTAEPKAHLAVATQGLATTATANEPATALKATVGPFMAFTDALTAVTRALATVTESTAPIATAATGLATFIAPLAAATAVATAVTKAAVFVGPFATAATTTPTASSPLALIATSTPLPTNNVAARTARLAAALYKSHSKLPQSIHASPTKRALHFVNVPNENQQQSERLTDSLLSPECAGSSVNCTSAHSLQLSPYRTTTISLSSASLLSSTSSSSAASSPEKRQLRSNCGHNVVDYTKRTLRSRNSLSKDMKVKTTMNLRRASSMAASQYLRTTAASLLAAAGQTQQQRQQQQQQHQNLQQQQRQLVVDNATGGDMPKQQTLSVSAAGAGCSSINLRSRQIVASSMNASSARSNSSAAASAGVNKLAHVAQRRERRSLRSSHGSKQQQSASLSNSTSFSKTTRQQSTASSSLAAPPPSPKLICAVTRARTLLATPQKAAASGVSSSLDYSKRASLRSGALNATAMVVNAVVNAATSAAGGVSKLPTRSSRLQRRLNR